MPNQAGDNKKRNPLFIFLDYMTDVMAAIGGILIAVMTLMICLAVIMRYGFRLSVGWSTELVEYFLYVAVMLATPWLLKRDGHVKVDVVLNMLSPEKRRWLELVGNVLALVASIAFFYYGWLAVQENFIKGTMMVRVMPVPKWVPLSVIPIMCIPLIYQFCRRIWKNIKWQPVEEKQ